MSRNYASTTHYGGLGGRRLPQDSLVTVSKSGGPATHRMSGRTSTLDTLPAHPQRRRPSRRSMGAHRKTPPAPGRGPRRLTLVDASRRGSDQKSIQFGTGAFEGGALHPTVREGRTPAASDRALRRPRVQSHPRAARPTRTSTRRIAGAARPGLHRPVSGRPPAELLSDV